MPPPPSGLPLLSSTRAIAVGAAVFAAVLILPGHVLFWLLGFHIPNVEPGMPREELFSFFWLTVLDPVVPATCGGAAAGFLAGRRTGTFLVAGLGAIAGCLFTLPGFTWEYLRVWADISVIAVVIGVPFGVLSWISGIAGALLRHSVEGRMWSNDMRPNPRNSV